MDDTSSYKSRIVAVRYELRQSLGSGGFGEVFLAYDRQLKREVALKRLIGSVSDEDFTFQVEHETKVHSQLSSGHIVALYDSFIWEGHYYLVLELMQASLAEQEEPAALEHLVTWARECLEGLRDIHAAGVIHRDLKPSNIFFDRNGKIRLGDFSSARSDESISLKAISPKYIAPEILQGDQALVGPASDLYSLGIMIYQLAIGDKGIRRAIPEIYQGGDRSETINNRWLLWHNNTERVAPQLKQMRPDIPPGFSDWVSKMMEKDQINRYQSAEEAQECLNIAMDLPPASNPPSPEEPASELENTEVIMPPPPIPPSPKKKRLLYQMTALALPLVIVFLILFLGPEGRNGESTVTFVLNTKGWIRIEGKKPEYGLRIALPLVPGNHKYMAGAPGYDTCLGEINIIRERDSIVSIHLIKSIDAIAEYNEGCRQFGEDNEKAFYHFQRSARVGHAGGQYYTGLMYYEGLGIDKNEKEAIRWFRMSAEQSDPRGQFKLGVMYQLGEGVPRNYTEAMNWYIKSANQGDTCSQNNIGSMYEQGLAVARDYATAASWYRKAAEQGCTKAGFNLGQLYESGKGVPQDIREALNWYGKAASQGNEEAIKALARLRESRNDI